MLRRSKKIFWKIYAWIYSALNIFGWLTILIAEAKFASKDILGVIITIIELTALFAFSYNRRLKSALLWKLLFIIFISQQIVTVVSEGGEFSLALIINIAICIPSYIAFFLYAFRSPEIWGQEKGVRDIFS